MYYLRHYFSFVCTFQKVFNNKNSEVKVVVQKGPLKFRIFPNNRCVGSIQFTSSIVIIW